ncbi:unnamed protein product [Leptidea sinapis]|uniref:Glucosamine-6-phosphate deaminase n=1 Tax=Leptidea sinapis TaxID=189913 RepID=A0A5E4R4A9_9NEOP|nr:unnamed protein product [Leptidea sinapis]
MRLIILEDADAVAEWAARFVLQRITEFAPGPGRRFVMGLPTGGTPLGMYRRLIDFHRQGRISFKYVTTFNMDEYVGLPREHPESYHYYMWNEFFKHIDIDPAQAHVLNGNAPDLVAECQRFEDLIKEAGGPGSSLVSRTRIKTLAYDTLEANKRFFGNDISKVPAKALTVGVGTVMDAKEVMILITGAHKALALAKAVEEGVNHMWTVSAFQQHPQAVLVCDDDATLELRVKTVKYFKSLMIEHNKLIADG